MIKKNIIFSTIAMFVFCCLGSVISVQETTPSQPQSQQIIEMSIVVVNPSGKNAKTVPIKQDLPIEVTPEAILDSDGLEIKYDEERSLYYLFKENVVLKPAETKIFDVKIRDVWIIPQDRLDSLRNKTESLIRQFEQSEFYDPVQRLGETIYKALETITTTQNDKTVSRKNHIILHRNNLKIMDQVKKNISKLEKQKDATEETPKKGIFEGIMEALPGIFK